MAGLTDLPCELLVELLLYSTNPSLATVCRWTYLCLRRPTPRLCYKFARECGNWRKVPTIASCLKYRFLSTEVLDQIKKNKAELRASKKRRKSGESETKLDDVKIPTRLFRFDENGGVPVNARLRAGRKRKRDDNAEGGVADENQRRFDLVKRLLSMKLSVGGPKGNTALLMSARAGNLPMVRMLLKHGADATAGGENKALLMAVVSGHLLVAKRLVKAGAPVTSLALRYAVQKKHLRVISWLMKKGAAPDMVTIKLLDSL
ncbi:hypothetical protein GQ54DRAFT_318147 [Martensiomyces pterosporus]|nr:hypothetical protein GQ54DRAFT_318147 [Martensiomyces pterosporus]